MKVSSSYQLVEVAGENLLVPIGKQAEECKDVFSLTKASAYLFKMLSENRTKEELVSGLIDKFGIEMATAIADVDQFVCTLDENGLLCK